VLIGDHLAAAVYNEQDGCGYVLVELQPQVKQRPTNFWFGGMQGGLIGPVVTPDGRHLVSAEGLGDGWWFPERDEDGEEIDDTAHLETPSDGGVKQVGTLHIHDLSTDKVMEKAIEIDLPAGWLPDEGKTQLDSGRLYELRVAGSQSVSVLLPTGERRVLQL
jgi:hypothetical protein